MATIGVHRTGLRYAAVECFGINVALGTEPVTLTLALTSPQIPRYPGCRDPAISSIIVPNTWYSCRRELSSSPARGKGEAGGVVGFFDSAIQRMSRDPTSLPTQLSARL